MRLPRPAARIIARIIRPGRLARNSATSAGENGVAPLRVPHDPRYRLGRMANRFDDAVVGDRPNIERRPRVEGGKVMIAVDLSGLAVDADDLALAPHGLRRGVTECRNAAESPACRDKRPRPATRAARPDRAAHLRRRRVPEHRRPTPQDRYRQSTPSPRCRPPRTRQEPLP